jgi:hypothetical protein
VEVGAGFDLRTVFQTRNVNRIEVSDFLVTPENLIFVGAIRTFLPSDLIAEVPRRETAEDLLSGVAYERREDVGSGFVLAIRKDGTPQAQADKVFPDQLSKSISNVVQMDDNRFIAVGSASGSRGWTVAFSLREPSENLWDYIAPWVKPVWTSALARGFGIAFWIPPLFIWLSYWIFTKLKTDSYISIMLGFVMGHTLWMILGHAMLISTGRTSPDLAGFAVDLIAVIIGVIWCLKRPSVYSCAFVLLYQIIVLGVNVVLFNKNVNASQAAAVMHVILRAVGSGMAIYAIVQTWRERKERLGSMQVRKTFA